MTQEIPKVQNVEENALGNHREIMSTMVVGNQWGINKIDPGPAQPSPAQPSPAQPSPAQRGAGDSGNRARPAPPPSSFALRTSVPGFNFLEIQLPRSWLGSAESNYHKIPLFYDLRLFNPTPADALKRASRPPRRLPDPKGRWDSRRWTPLAFQRAIGVPMSPRENISLAERSISRCDPGNPESSKC